MSDSPGLNIRPFSPADQVAVRKLVLDGLREHFGALDEAFNEDLADIQRSYIEQGHFFLVAEAGTEIAGTGALLLGEADGQIVRVSVSSGRRGAGIGRAILAALFSCAQARGLASVWMETNDDWTDAIKFYRSAGFEAFDHREGCIFMRRTLDPQPRR